ncbi:MAG: glycosyltransferase family 39 protein [Synechococcales bacterium]|nr:glycosyltransferase family 39 protein [Synechococcales bacterium]
MKQFRASGFYPYITLLLWVGVLLLCRSGQQSLMAHDEGIYATQARTILQTGDWITPQWGGGFSFDRTIGIQWLIALSYLVFGVSEDTVRLPSVIAFMASVCLIYRLGLLLLTPRLAWLAAAIFSVVPISLQYARLGTQDTVLVCVELLGIWALLEGEHQKKRSLSLLTGAAFGWGFLIKGFMIIPATIALFPYLMGSHRSHRHLFNPWLYGGLLLGSLPVLGWLAGAIAQYGMAPVQELFGKLFHLKQQTYQGAGPFYYFWNVPINGFPWVLVGLVGGILAVCNQTYQALLNQRWLLLIGFPAALFLELTLFGTKTHYYPLQLMPWFALMAAIAIHHCTAYYLQDRRSLLLGKISQFLTEFSLLLLLAGFSVLSGWFKLDHPDASKIAVVVLVLAMGWLMPGVLWGQRSSTNQPTLVNHWIASLLLAPWLALSLLGLTGLWGNYNPELKTFLEQPAIAQTLKTQTVHFLVDEAQLSREDRKRYLLLTFYTHNLGQHWDQPQQLLPESYVWVAPLFPMPPNSTVVNTHVNWNLIRTAALGFGGGAGG